MHLVAKNGWKDVVEYLIEIGADVHAKNNDNQAVLHLALRNGWKDVVENLIEIGADIGAKNNDN